MIEESVYQTLKNAIETAATDSPLLGAEVYSTEFERINAEYGFQIGDVECEFAPRINGEIDEYNAAMNLKTFVRVGEVTPEKLVQSRTHLAGLMRAAVKVFQDDPNLGNAVCDIHVESGKRGWGKVESIRYAVGIISLKINER
jgi:hypothetical protein